MTVFVVLLAIAVIAVIALVWWDGWRYPLCPQCGSNRHVQCPRGVPTCTIHGPIRHGRRGTMSVMLALAFLGAACDGGHRAAQNRWAAVRADAARAEASVAAHATEPRACGRERRNCSTAVAAIGKPGSGSFVVVWFTWGDDRTTAGRFYLTRIGSWRGVATSFSVTAPGDGDPHGYAILAWKVPVRQEGRWQEVIASAYPNDGAANAGASATVAPLGWPSATSGRVTSVIGDPRPDNRRHAGVDIGAPYGSAVLATDDGIVTSSRWGDGYGYRIRIRHSNGLETLYAHHAANLVREGERVRRNQIIAYVGTTGHATGPHIHYEVRDPTGKPVDPLRFVQ